MRRLHLGIALTGVAVIIALVGVSLSAYVIHPGSTALLLRGSRVVAKDIGPGLHWKIPLVESLVVLDARVQLMSARVDSQGGQDSDTFSAPYTAAWRVASPTRFYAATGGDAAVVNTKLDAVLESAMKKMIEAGNAKSFLRRPADAIRNTLAKAAGSAAKPLGIAVVGVYPGAGGLPQSLADKVGENMAAATRNEITAAKKKESERAATIRDKGEARAAEIVAAANARAATIHGEGEAKTVAIYAAVSGDAPQFFDFYQQLQAERRQLLANTKLLVISVDSPWFRALGPAGKQGGGG